MKHLLSTFVLGRLITAASLQWQTAPAPHAHTGKVQPKESNLVRAEVHFHNNTEHAGSCDFERTPNALMDHTATVTLRRSLQTLEQCQSECCNMGQSCASFSISKTVANPKEVQKGHVEVYYWCIFYADNMCTKGFVSNSLGTEFLSDTYSKKPVGYLLSSSANGRLCPSGCADVASFCATAACGGCGACAPCYPAVRQQEPASSPSGASECADGSTEAVFVTDDDNFAQVVGCDGTWENGIDGAEALCGADFHICEGKAWRQLNGGDWRSNTADGERQRNPVWDPTADGKWKMVTEAEQLLLTEESCQTIPQPGKFYVSRQSSADGQTCTAKEEGVEQRSVWGCGKDGKGRVFETNQCGALNKVWGVTTPGTTVDGESPVTTFEAWRFRHELHTLNHNGGDGGVLCCRVKNKQTEAREQERDYVALACLRGHYSRKWKSREVDIQDREAEIQALSHGWEELKKRGAHGAEADALCTVPVRGDVQETDCTFSGADDLQKTFAKMCCAARNSIARDMEEQSQESESQYWAEHTITVSMWADQDDLTDFLRSHGCDSAEDSAEHGADSGPE